MLALRDAAASTGRRAGTADPDCRARRGAPRGRRRAGFGAVPAGAHRPRHPRGGDHHQRAVVTVAGTVTNVGDRPVRDVMVRLEHAAAVTSSAGLRTNLGGDDRPIRTGRRLHHPVAPNCNAARMFRSPCRPAALRRTCRRWASSSRACTRCWSTPTARRTTASPPGSTMPASCCRCSGCRRIRPPTRRPTTLADVVPPDTSKPVRPHHAVAAGRPAAAGRGRPRRHHAGAADRRRARRLAGDRAGGWTPCCRRSDFATSPPSTPAARCVSALCLAVDPDLLVTVNAMTGGYVVNDGPDAGPATPDASGRRPGGRRELAESAQGAGPADVRRADARTPRPTSTPCTGSAIRG